MMFIRTLITTTLLLGGTTAAFAQSKNAGEACFWNAVEEARSLGGDYRTVLFDRRLRIVDIANSVSVNKWRIKWENLDEERKQLVMGRINKTLSSSEEVMANINFDSIWIKSEQKTSYISVWGRYEEITGQEHSFGMFVVAEDCTVIRFTWDGIRLSRHIARQIQ